jgi:hypothetical protein
MSITTLAGIGIAITQGPAGSDSWGWSMQNEKIIHDWEGPFATPAEAIQAALAWLLEHARRGLICKHLHAAALQATTLPLDVSATPLDWLHRRN